MSWKPEVNKPRGFLGEESHLLRKSSESRTQRVRKECRQAITRDFICNFAKVSLDRQFHMMSAWTRSLKATGVGNLDMSSWSKSFRRDRFLEYNRYLGKLQSISF